LKKQSHIGVHYGEKTRANHKISCGKITNNFYAKRQKESIKMSKDTEKKAYVSENKDSETKTIQIEVPNVDSLLSLSPAKLAALMAEVEKMKEVQDKRAQVKDSAYKTAFDAMVSMGVSVSPYAMRVFRQLNESGSLTSVAETVFQELLKQGVTDLTQYHKIDGIEYVHRIKVRTIKAVASQEKTVERMKNALKKQQDKVAAMALKVNQITTITA